MDKEQSQFIRPKEFARLASVSLQTVYEAIWRGDIKAKKVSPRIWLIDRDEVIRWGSVEDTAMEQVG